MSQVRVSIIAAQTTVTSLYVGSKYCLKNVYSAIFHLRSKRLHVEEKSLQPGNLF